MTSSVKNERHGMASQVMQNHWRLIKFTMGH